MNTLSQNIFARGFSRSLPDGNCKQVEKSSHTVAVTSVCCLTWSKFPTFNSLGGIRCSLGADGLLRTHEAVGLNSGVKNYCRELASPL